MATAAKKALVAVRFAEHQTQHTRH